MSKAGSKTRKTRDPIPDHFAGVDEAAEFWESHDLTDYWNQTGAARFQVDLKTRRFLTALDPDLAQKLVVRARQRGISTETLINIWLTEKLESGS